MTINNCKLTWLIPMMKNRAVQNLEKTLASLPKTNISSNPTIEEGFM